MPLTDYTADAHLNWLAGRRAMPGSPAGATPPALWLALLTGVGTDAGTGFTEVTGGAYARVQVAGHVATSATTATSSNVLTFSAVPAWVVVGMTAYDVTATGAITGGQTVTAVTATTVTLSANVNGAVGSGDTIVFSAFGAPAGSAPSSITNSAVIGFAQATAAWGTVIAFGLYDAATSGNLLLWDFLGNYPWLPATVSSASPAVVTAHAHGYAAGDPVVATAEYMGTLPTVSAGGPLTGYTVNYAKTVATDTFGLNTAANGAGTDLATSATGDMAVRKITQQAIAANVTPSFAASTFTLTAA